MMSLGHNDVIVEFSDHCFRKQMIPTWHQAIIETLLTDDNADKSPQNTLDKIFIDNFQQSEYFHS